MERRVLEECGGRGSEGIWYYTLPTNSLLGVSSAIDLTKKMEQSIKIDFAKVSSFTLELTNYSTCVQTTMETYPEPHPEPHSEPHSEPFKLVGGWETPQKLDLIRVEFVERFGASPKEMHSKLGFPTEFGTWYFKTADGKDVVHIYQDERELWEQICKRRKKFDFNILISRKELYEKFLVWFGEKYGLNGMSFEQVTPLPDEFIQVKDF